MGGGYIAHIDADSTYTNTFKGVFLVKYDTSGNYQWLQLPQSDTIGITSITNTRILDMDVDGGGNVSIFCKLAPGAYNAGAYVASDTGFYVLKYNAPGSFQGGVQLDMDIMGNSVIYIQMAKDPQNGRYYFGGQQSTGSVVLGGNVVLHTMYAACYDGQGDFLWKRENDNIGDAGLNCRPAIDDSGYVYMAGISHHNDVFNGHTSINTVTAISHATPFIVKMDSVGNLIWAKNASVNAISYASALALRNNNEVVMTGSYPGILQWPGATTVPSHVPNQGYDVFITRFNTHTGEVTGVDTLGSGFGFADAGTAIAAGGNGEIYVGGEFSANLVVNGTTLNSTGGETDFFVAKFGLPCGCVTPVCNFTFAGAGPTISFTYSGTTPYDSVKWYFGDGATSTQVNPTHTYTTDGSYNVCATVYTECDSNQYCQNIPVAVSVNTVAGIEGVSVYPNPVTEALQVRGMVEATDYRLMNVTGVVLQQGVLQVNDNSISTKDLSPGLYLLELRNKQQHGVVRVMKQ